jgi:glycosyltransferase involved in cell wall biosynthesis
MQHRKVLLLNTQMEPAGAQKAMLELGKGLKDRGYQISIATMYDKANYIPIFEGRYDLNIINLRMKREEANNPFRKVFHVVQGFSDLFKLIRNFKPDILQTFSHYSNIFGIIIAWIARVPVRISSQRMSLKGSPGWILQLNRIITNSSLTNKMVAVSEGTKRFSIDIQGINPNKLIVIHNGIDTKRFSQKMAPEEIVSYRAVLGLSVENFVITTVARLHPQKGHSYLFEAIAKILQENPHSHFLLVGEGVLETKLKHLIAEKQLTAHVSFLGVRQDIPEILEVSDLFVLPSLWEGLPNSVLEAMALSLPIVSTNVDGCPEVVQDGITGILVPAKDSGSLAIAINTLIFNDELRINMGKNGRNRVLSQFDQEKNIDQFVKLYQSLLEVY